MDDDPFGFCYRLEKDLAKVLDKAGLAALTDQVRGRFDAAAQMARVPDERPGADQGYLRGSGPRSCARSTSRRSTSTPT